MIYVECKNRQEEHVNFNKQKYYTQFQVMVAIIIGACISSKYSLLHRIITHLTRNACIF